MNTLKMQKKAQIEADQVREGAELVERAHKAVEKSGKAAYSDGRAVELYIDKLRKARAEIVRKYSDLPQVNQLAALIDVELASAMRQLAGAVIDGLRGW